MKERGFRLLEIQAVEHLDRELWQLKPEPYRVLFYWDENEKAYVLLNGFRKTSNKTPRRELEMGLRLMAEHKEQSSPKEE